MGRVAPSKITILLGLVIRAPYLQDPAKISLHNQVTLIRQLDKQRRALVLVNATRQARMQRECHMKTCMCRPAKNSIKVM